MNGFPRPFRRMALALTILLAWLPVLANDGISARQSDTDPSNAFDRLNARTVDLPAMALRPADLADEGVGEYGTSFAILTDDADQAGEFVDYGLIDPSHDDAGALVAADADRYYVLQISDSRVNDDAIIVYNVMILSFVLEYDDAEAAEDGLDAMEDVGGDSDTLDRVRMAEDIGDNAFYFEGEGIDNSDGLPTERTLLVFQRDTIVTGILTYNSNLDGTFGQDVNEALGQTLLDRVEEGLDGDAPGLSSTIVRLDVPGIGSFNDAYMTIDGEILCGSDAWIADACGSFQDLIDDYNEVDRYGVTFNILSGTNEAHSFVSVSIRTFEDEESAAERFAEMRESRQTSTAKIEELDLGDESIRLGETIDTTALESIIVRSGTSIIEVDQQATYPITPDGVYDLAALQAACLDGEESCTDPVDIPHAMLPTAFDGLSSPPADVIMATLPDAWPT